MMQEHSRAPPYYPQGASGSLLTPNLIWAKGLETLAGSRPVPLGCSASWQGPSVVVAPGPKGSLKQAVLCCVMSRKRQSQVLWGAPG